MPNSRQRLGAAGEAAAARFLESRGYRIVARNVRADRVELDLIALRGSLLVFVEVKTRRSERHGSAAEAVDARKQERLRRGARAWLRSEPDAARGHRSVRFDVVTCLEVADRSADGARPRDETACRITSSPFGAWAPDEATAPGRARWWIEHWEAAF